MSYKSRLKGKLVEKRIILHHLKYFDTALYTANLIADSRLSSVANIEIRKQSDIIDHWAESNIKEAMENGWIDTTNTF